MKLKSEVYLFSKPHVLSRERWVAPYILWAFHFLVVKMS